MSVSLFFSQVCLNETMMKFAWRADDTLIDQNDINGQDATVNLNSMGSKPKTK